MHTRSRTRARQALREASSLRRQLVRAVNSHRRLAGAELLPARMPRPPAKAEELLLLQLLTSAFLDQCAKKDEAAGARRRGRHVPFRALSSDVDGPVFVHPRSAVYDPDPRNVSGRRSPSTWRRVCS